MILSASNRRASSFDLLDSAVTGTRGEKAVWTNKLLLVVPKIDGGTVGTNEPPGFLIRGQSGGKCLS